jgi:hypothetical protein
MGVPTNETDPRLLGWHLQDCLKKVSLSCYLASLIFMWRLKKDYVNGIKDVASIYYYPQGLNQNPYSKWWVS